MSTFTTNAPLAVDPELDDRRGAPVRSREATPRPTGPVRTVHPWWAHVPFAVILLLAAVPRVVAVWGYRPVLMFFGDSQGYLTAAQRGEPAGARPFAYSAFLRLMSWTHHIGWVPVVQHAAILVLGVVLYVTLVRLGAPIWLAAVVPAPMLLDGYQVLIEHLAMTEVMFTCLLMAALLLAIRRRVTTASGIVMGLLLATTVLTRTVALPLVAIVIAYLVVRRVGWRPIAGLALAFSLPVVAYAVWFSSFYGVVGLQLDGRFLYARVAPIADCTRLPLAPAAQRLCDPTTVSARQGSNYYAWSRSSPFNRIDVAPNDRAQLAARDALGRRFGLAVITGQPVDYARLVGSDLVHYFSPGRTAGVQDTPPAWWNFRQDATRPGQQVVLGGSGFADDKVSVQLHPDAASFLRGWQRVLGTQGLLLLGCLVLAIVGAATGRRMAWGARRIDAMLFASVGFVLLLIPSATSVFDYRYMLPAAVPLYAAGGWGALLLIQRRRLARDPRSRVLASSHDTPAVRHRARSRTGRWIAAATIAVGVLAVAFAPMKPEPGYAAYVVVGAERGTLGYSFNSQHAVPGRPGWLVRDFEGGSIYVSPSGSTQVITQSPLSAYRGRGGADVFGMPVAGTTPLIGWSGAAVTWFERGAIVTTGRGSVLVVQPPLLQEWCEPRTLCSLGPPLAAAEDLPGGTVRQTFARGALTKRPGEPVRVTMFARPVPSPGSSTSSTDAGQTSDVRGG